VKISLPVRAEEPGVAKSLGEHSIVIEPTDLAYPNLRQDGGRLRLTVGWEDLRRFQRPMKTQRASAATMNTAVSALRFFFGVMPRRGDARLGLTTVRLPQRLPVIISPAEVARLLEPAALGKRQATKT
jgi:site-specific recombinase XerD